MGKKTRFPEFKAELREREAHSKAVGKRIRETSGKERMQLWEDKRSYGRDTRAVLLAYGFLRGWPRARVEPTAEMPWWLPYAVVREAKRLGRELVDADIRYWLRGYPSPVPVTVRVPEPSNGQAVPDRPL